MNFRSVTNFLDTWCDEVSRIFVTLGVTRCQALRSNALRSNALRSKHRQRGMVSRRSPFPQAVSRDDKRNSCGTTNRHKDRVSFREIWEPFFLHDSEMSDS